MNWEEIRRLIKEGDFYYALPQVLKLVCTKTSASRCNFWHVDEEFLVPVYNYDAERGDYTLEGLKSLNLKDAPKYYQSLLKNNILFIEDVYEDHAASELSEEYWKPFNIQSV
ncbi:hypothetical protein [Thermocrinis sp.]